MSFTMEQIGARFAKGCCGLRERGAAYEIPASDGAECSGSLLGSVPHEQHWEGQSNQVVEQSAQAALQSVGEPCPFRRLPSELRERHEHSINASGAQAWELAGSLNPSRAKAVWCFKRPKQ